MCSCRQEKAVKSGQIWPTGLVVAVAVKVNPQAAVVSAAAVELHKLNSCDRPRPSRRGLRGSVGGLHFWMRTQLPV